MRNWKLFGKIGAIALTALGLALVPGDFNVPGVGTVEAFAEDTVDLEGATIELNEATAVYTGDVIAPGIKSVTLKDGVTKVGNISDLEVVCDEEIKDAKTYNVNVAAKSSNTTDKYTGEATATTFEVTKANMKSVAFSTALTDQDFDPFMKSVGELDMDQIVGNAEVQLNGVKLDSSDYTLSFADKNEAPDAGTHEIVISQKSDNFATGSNTTAEFKIKPYELKGENKG